MIISKQHGVVYVAIPKTGSQSISSALESALKPEMEQYAGESLHDWHASLDEVKEVSDLPLEDYWSFAFVRNPYDRFISYCAGHVQGFVEDPQNAIAIALDDAMRGGNRRLLPQVHFLGGVRKIYKYEELNESLADIAERLSVDLGKVPVLNASDRGEYAGYYDASLKRDISKIYQSDLFTLNYRF